MKPAAAIIITSILCASFTSCDSIRKNEPLPKTVIELDSGWQFREAGSDSDWMPASVPGCVHTDLLSAGVIPDPFFGENEKDLQWIEEKEYDSVEQLKGSVSQATCSDPTAFERGNYMKVLTSFVSDVA